MGTVSLVRVRTMRMCDGISSLPSEACCEVVHIFRNEAIEEFLQITACGWIGIFHDDHAATGMLDKNGRRPRLYTALVDL